MSMADDDVGRRHRALGGHAQEHSRTPWLLGVVSLKLVMSQSVYCGRVWC